MQNGLSGCYKLSKGKRCYRFGWGEGSIFRSYKGLRQGDPLFPVLFNFVADVLSAMLSKASRGGFVSGLVPELVEED